MFMFNHEIHQQKGPSTNKNHLKTHTWARDNTRGTVAGFLAELVEGSHVGTVAWGKTVIRKEATSHK